MSNRLEQIVAAELKKCLRAFMIEIHPDKFYSTPHASRSNEETLKFILNFGNAFTDNLQSEPSNRDRLVFPLKFTPLRFHNRLLKLQTHHLPTDTACSPNADDSMTVSWEEVAYSLFSMVTKAQVDHDERISNALLQQLECQKEVKTNLQTKRFFELLHEHLNKPDHRNVEFKKALAFCQIEAGDDRESLVQSIWKYRDILSSISDRFPQLKISFSSSEEKVFIKDDVCRLPESFTAKHLDRLLSWTRKLWSFCFFAEDSWLPMRTTLQSSCTSFPRGSIPRFVLQWEVTWL